MAQSRKKTTSTASSKSPRAKSRSTAAPKSVNPRSAPRSSVTVKQPRRREIAAAVCLLLGVFSLIGYFDSEPVFISFFTGFVKRFIGNGFFALPPALIMCAVILGFHKGYPVLLRVISTLSITAVIGALVHTFAYALVTPDDKYELSFSMFGKLWSSGALHESGGIISGGVAQLFLVLFGRVGTVVLLIIMLAVLALIAFNATLAGVISAVRGREMRPYEIRDESSDDNAAQTPEEMELEERTRQSHRFPLFPQRKRKKIDIPLDDKPAKKDVFADDSGDALSKTVTPWNVDDRSGQGGGTQDDYDLPLNIPFMEGRRNRPPRPPVTPSIEEADFLGKGAASGVFDDTIPKPPYTMDKKRKLPDLPPPEGKDVESVIDIDTDEDNTYKMPPLELLSQGDPPSKAGSGEVESNSDRLEAAFQSFGINVNITNATRGPSVTRYEAELEAGIKLSRLTGLADDIALALGTIGVRIAAMPNKRSTVGIEVPNKTVSKVHLRDIIESAEFEKSQSKLTFAIGMDITGEKITGDISKLPHMLIAGTTGSGKSVCLNSIILSLLYKSTPEEVRLIMIDPKLVEFKVYANIPHLLVPLVTEAKMASGALQTAVAQMMKRYNLFSDNNARDIEGYNAIAKKSKGEIEPMSRIVIIIDELADLMLTAAKEVEESVCRIAQMGRAAGIHLVIATQSPRANVITGLMKANIPSRIAFKVASALESQIILDPGQNADKLVGNGDMLYAPIGAAKPMRLQGTWVTDKEREKVVDYIKEIGEAKYSDEFIHDMEKAVADKTSGGGSADGAGADVKYDELLPQAVDVFLESGQASVSLLQRRLSLGYARAARIVDQMEDMGIIGKFEGSKSREMLVTRDQWRQMQYGTGVAPVERITEPSDDDFPIVTSVSGD